MTQELRNQITAAAAVLREAKKKTESARDTKAFADRSLDQAIEAERVATHRYYTFVNRLLDEPAS